jgi:50S ribosomal subunit-associated GTPase HflX
MVYSVDNPESFDAIFSVWNPALENCSQVPHITILVGTKTDLSESERAVDAEKVERSFEIGPLFVSALNGAGVEELKETIAQGLEEQFYAKKNGEIGKNVRGCRNKRGEIDMDGGCGCFLL